MTVAARRGAARPGRTTPLRSATATGFRRAQLSAENETAVRDFPDYAHMHFEDPPEIRDWRWPEG